MQNSNENNGTTPATDKPVLKLVGKDGNGYYLLGLAQQAARKAGWPHARTRAFLEEAMGGDYDHLLQTIMAHFDVE